jgi:predicted kinase
MRAILPDCADKSGQRCEQVRHQYRQRVTRLIHLNGPPGIGKSTLARRYVDEHPGVLNCDVDVLRTLIGGWRQDFGGAGALIRPAALAMIEAYLANGHDVVFPQMLVDPAELARFEEAATSVGAEFVERFLMETSVAAGVARFGRRGAAEASDPWHGQVRVIVAELGGDAALAEFYAGLESLLLDRPNAIVITSAEGAVERTYRELADSLA